MITPSSCSQKSILCHILLPGHRNSTTLTMCCHELSSLLCILLKLGFACLFSIFGITETFDGFGFMGALKQTLTLAFCVPPVLEVNYKAYKSLWYLIYNDFQRGIKLNYEAGDNLVVCCGVHVIIKSS